MPGEEKRLPPRPQSLNLADRTRLAVTGVEEVESFDEERIVMRTVLGELTVTGSGLHVGRLSLDAGELNVEGTVNGLVYSEREEAGGFWSRLFG